MVKPTAFHYRPPYAGSAAGSATGHERPRVLGLWDVRKAPLRLGNMVILVEELQAQAELYDGEVDGVCFIHDSSRLLPVSATPERDGAMAPLDASACADSAALSVLINLEGVSSCYHAGSVSAVKEFLYRQLRPYVVWPSLDTLDGRGRIDYAYGSTLFLQGFFKERGRLPSISAKPEPLRWAREFIETHVRPAYPVVAHMKNAPPERCQSNANVGAWGAFFEDSVARRDVKFVLIGNEDVDDRIRRLPNVIVTQDFGSAVARDLALIQTACAYMGMASGPCSMAMFSDIPYLICKHPDHTPDKMARELGDRDHFSFAAPTQKILRIFETRELLMSEFKRLWSQVDLQRWERRLRGRAL